MHLYCTTENAVGKVFKQQQLKTAKIKNELQKMTKATVKVWGLFKETIHLTADCAMQSQMSRLF